MKKADWKKEKREARINWNEVLAKSEGFVKTVEVSTQTYPPKNPQASFITAACKGYDLTGELPQNDAAAGGVFGWGWGEPSVVLGASTWPK